MGTKTVLKIQKIESFAFFDNSRLMTTEKRNLTLLHLPCQFRYVVLCPGLRYASMQIYGT